MMITFGIYYSVSIAVKKAKLFANGRSQAVRLPKEFRFAGAEVFIERRGDEVVLRAVGAPAGADAKSAGHVKTLGDLARHFREIGGVSEDFARAVREARTRDRDWPERDFE